MMSFAEYLLESQLPIAKVIDDAANIPVEVLDDETYQKFKMLDENEVAKSLLNRYATVDGSTAIGNMTVFHKNGKITHAAICDVD